MIYSNICLPKVEKKISSITFELKKQNCNFFATTDKKISFEISQIIKL
jgi:hypothetical protein